MLESPDERQAGVASAAPPVDWEPRRADPKMLRNLKEREHVDIAPAAGNTDTRRDELRPSPTVVITAESELMIVRGGARRENGEVRRARAKLLRHRTYSALAVLQERERQPPSVHPVCPMRSSLSLSPALLPSQFLGKGQPSVQHRPASLFGCLTPSRLCLEHRPCFDMRLAVD